MTICTRFCRQASAGLVAGAELDHPAGADVRLGGRAAHAAGCDADRDPAGAAFVIQFLPSVAVGWLIARDHPRTTATAFSAAGNNFELAIKAQPSNRGIKQLHRAQAEDRPRRGPPAPRRGEAQPICHCQTAKHRALLGVSLPAHRRSGKRGGKHGKLAALLVAVYCLGIRLTHQYEPCCLRAVYLPRIAARSAVNCCVISVSSGCTRMAM